MQPVLRTQRETTDSFRSYNLLLILLTEISVGRTKRSSVLIGVPCLRETTPRCVPPAMVADGSALDDMDADVLEVHRLLNQTQRALVREHLHGLLGELSEVRHHCRSPAAATICCDASGLTWPSVGAPTSTRPSPETPSGNRSVPKPVV